MGYLRVSSGMGRLLVDGLDIGAVYYELDRSDSEASGPITGKLSGEPYGLCQAHKEGKTTLVLRDGHTVPVVVTPIMNDEYAALFHPRRDVPLEN